MVMKNNEQQCGQQVPHYGLRKLSVGVASVLLSCTFFMGMNQAVGMADTGTESATTTTEVAGSPTNGDQQPASTTSEQTSANQTQAAQAETNNIPQAQTSLNDHVGTASGQITVSNQQVATKPGNKLTGDPALTQLHLNLDIPKAQVEQLHSGDYIDIKLGLPYQTNDGGQYVMSYGAINKDAEPIIIRYNGAVAAYIVPTGELNSYQQTVSENGSLVESTNKNEAADSLGTSNGYYRIIFTDGVENYLKEHSGASTDWQLSVDLNWYNGLKNEDRKVIEPNRFTIYTTGDSTADYAPNNDLQVGDQQLASGAKFKVQKISTGDQDIAVANETVASDHTGNQPAHSWFKQGNGYYLGVVDPTQGVGLSLAPQDQAGNQLGRQFTITVTKPAGNGDVQLNFVAAKDVESQLQKLIVPTEVTSALADQVTGSGSYYLSHQYLYSQPKVTVTDAYSADGNTVTYTVNIDGDYKGFKATYLPNSGDGHYYSPITLITWKPSDSEGLMPPEDVQTPADDMNKVSYHSSTSGWIYGYPVKNTAITNYLKDKPWHVSVSNQNGYNYSTDFGYWIDRQVDSKPENNGYVSNHFYGWVNQTIHYVDETGHQMKDANGQAIPDTNRDVSFESAGDQNDFTGMSRQFDNVDVPQVAGYTTYAGVKDAQNHLVVTDGLAETSGGPIAVYGAESPFGYPHADFVEYVVYKPNPVAKSSVTIHYIDVGVNPSATTFVPADGTELTGQKQDYAGKVGDSYTNQLWDYRGAGYELATSSVDPKAEQGTFTSDHQDIYVYLKHRTSVDHQTFTAVETIRYVYANGEHAGETAAPEYTKTITYSRSQTKDLTNGTASDWTPWTADVDGSHFVDVDSPLIPNYQADILVVDAPQLAAADFQNGATKRFDYLVKYTTQEQPATPKTPTNPKTPTTPATPTTPTTPSTPVTPTNPTKPTKQVTLTTPNLSTKSATPTQATLPQTGNQQFDEAMALVIVSILTSLGIAIRPRKNN